MRTATYKAIACEYSHGRKGYHLGTGVAFSNSIKKAIEAAKDRAYDSLSHEEALADDSSTPVLATVEVYKGMDEVFFQSY